VTICGANDQLLRRERFNALVAQLDAAPADDATFAREQIAHRTQRRRLACAVASEQGNDAAFPHRK
jgi:hypothetical protein